MMSFRRKVRTDLQSEDIINQVCNVADELKKVVEGLQEVLLEIKKDENDPT